MDVLFEEQNHIGLITLNRSKALNALSFEMFKALKNKLEAWKDDENIHAVVIQAAESRAFCAGGDVRWIYGEGQKDNKAPLELFRHEYQLDYLTSTMDKPYIALMDGLNIGGGVGITLHGSHRVATENFAFTMPENSIGFFPDIGASYLLANCPDGYGVYLGLTGRRVNPADSKKLNFVDYTVSSDSLDEIKEALFATDLSTDANNKVSHLLSQFDREFPQGSLADEKEDVKACFDGKTKLGEVFDALLTLGNAWAIALVSELEALSPISLHVTLALLNRAKGLSLADCLALDYGLTYHFMQGHDFYEGVRARLVDKDKAPKWQPETWQAVNEGVVNKYFEFPQSIEPLW